MSAKLELARQFVHSRPQLAARALEKLPPFQVAQFVDMLSDEMASHLYATLLPACAAKCIAQLPVHKTGAQLSQLEPRMAAAILRHLPKELRKPILAKLSWRSRVGVSYLLDYPRTSVGAWLDPATLVISSGGTIGDAREHLHREGYLDHRRVYVVDASGQLQGFVPLTRLILGEEDSPLSTVMVSLPDALRAHASLESVAENENWQDHDYLPVVDRSNRFVGILRHATLRAALHDGQPGSQPLTPQPMASGALLQLAESCYIGLAEVMSTSLATSRPPAQRRGL